MIKIATAAKERGTIGFIVEFEDDDGTATPPDTLKWSWTDRAGNPVNGRQQVAVDPPLASNTVTLSGADLQILAAEAAKDFVKRRFVVEITYTSDLGTGLPANEVAEVDLENLTLIPVSE